MDPGFLDDPVRFYRAMERSAWPAGRKDQFVIILDTDDLPGDQARLYAVLAELYESRRHLITRAAAIRQTAAALENAIKQFQQRIETLKADIARIEKIAENRPSGQRLQKLETELADRKAPWQTAVEAIRSIQAEIDALQPKAGQTTSPEQAQALTQKQLDLAAVKLKEADLRQSYEQKLKELQSTQAAAAAARSAGQTIDRSRGELVNLQFKLDNARDDLELRQHEVNQLLEPIPPDESRDVKRVATFDPRTSYTIVALGTLLVGFGVLIFLKLREIRLEAQEKTTMNDER